MLSEEYDEWGVRVNNTETVWIKGQGFYGELHAKQEAERILHNSKLPSVGQPTTAVAVKRHVVKTFEASEWVDQ